MLRGKTREYVIKKIKDPLRKFIIFIAKRLPEPNEGNITHPNSQRLLTIRDKFFKYDNNDSRRELYKAAWKILICEYEHDPVYRYHFDNLITEIANSGWQPPPPGRQRGGFGGEYPV